MDIEMLPVVKSKYRGQKNCICDNETGIGRNPGLDINYSSRICFQSFGLDCKLLHWVQFNLGYVHLKFARPMELFLRFPFSFWNVSVGLQVLNFEICNPYGNFWISILILEISAGLQIWSVISQCGL